MRSSARPRSRPRHPARCWARSAAASRQRAAEPPRPTAPRGVLRRRPAGPAHRRGPRPDGPGQGRARSGWWSRGGSRPLAAPNDELDFATIDPVVLRRRRSAGSACCRRSTARRTGSPRGSTAARASPTAPPSRRGRRRGARRPGGLRRPAGRPLRARRATLWAEHPEVDADADPRLADLERAELADLLPAGGRPGRLREAARRAARRRSRERDPEAEVILGGMFGTPHGGRPPPRPGTSCASSTRSTAPATTSTPSPPTRTPPSRRRSSCRSAPARRDRAGGDDDAGMWITEVGASSDAGRRTRSSAGPRARPSSCARRSSSSSPSARRLNIEGVDLVLVARHQRPDSQCDWCPGSGLFEEESLTPEAGLGRVRLLYRRVLADRG